MTYAERDRNACREETYNLVFVRAKNDIRYKAYGSPYICMSAMNAI